ncbi:MAG: hypothetical protein AB7G75_14535 [Candidatus Binatia bacterium]
MHWIPSGLLSLLLSIPVHAFENEPTYCDDPAVWADWETKAEQQAKDLDFQTLHALWIGLCAKVKSGALTTDDADAVFERARGILIQQRREAEQNPSSPTF